jgi:hypothetical protein
MSELTDRRAVKNVSRRQRQASSAVVVSSGRPPADGSPYQQYIIKKSNGVRARVYGLAGIPTGARVSVKRDASGAVITDAGNARPAAGKGTKLK